MHMGSFDSEEASISKVETYVKENGLYEDFSEGRRHHEIYLSDFRKTIPEKRRTIIRHPVRR